MNLAWTNGARSWLAIAAAGLFTLATGLVAGCANSSGGAACDPECPTFYECCGGTGGPSCRDIVNDPTNCGGCGVTCPSGICREASCVPGTGPTDGGTAGTDGGAGGDCRPSCSADQRCCGTSCVSRSGVAVGSDGRSDPSFGSCNGCGIACDAERASACSVPGGGAGTPRCMCGSLDQCNTGELCVPEAGTFTCVSTGNDPNNCGGVGIRCGTGESCVGGTCQCGSTGGACSGGQACCGTGCVDLQTDFQNCGFCGTACTPSADRCTAGNCACGSGPVCDLDYVCTGGSC